MQADARADTGSDAEAVANAHWDADATADARAQHGSDADAWADSYHDSESTVRLLV